ncbi:hypothetical protein BVRB_4g088490 [Beta vulgaris subsp. vulgaris]|nr:hypothetical protein BVRB_4g088490 [Beta vulgaris subsp. vulgaris]
MNKRCDHCGMRGHIKAECFKINGPPQWFKDLQKSKGVNKYAANVERHEEFEKADTPLDDEELFGEGGIFPFLNPSKERDAMKLDFNSIPMFSTDLMQVKEDDEMMTEESDKDDQVGVQKDIETNIETNVHNDELRVTNTDENAHETEEEVVLNDNAQEELKRSSRERTIPKKFADYEFHLPPSNVIHKEAANAYSFSVKMLPGVKQYSREYLCSLNNVIQLFKTAFLGFIG